MRSLERYLRTVLSAVLEEGVSAQMVCSMSKPHNMGLPKVALSWHTMWRMANC